jgi:hypothetical protein
MRAVHVILVVIRNLYITVVVLPLWIWSAIYRAVPGALRLSSPYWVAFSVLALFYGAFGLWFFTERAVEAHYTGKPSTSLNISVYAIAVTLFIACLGAVVDRGSNGWGNFLFVLGIDLLPLILLFSFLASSPTPDRKKQKEAEPEMSQELATEEHA